ncbi:CPBP family intramembrane glutamic endopeptidase [Enterococcus faecium]|uniref:CPBP family intramembrane glutamic endopeptidase n=1 Tax=Enterococcus TaxID=1350 RepID=UPI0009BEC66A|nr:MULTISPECIES: CPBP family intramembrane glutamic endopeptidase [Enterococcus]EGP5171122.1 CPBP family intramembrane metalloprotease [Enterococcus faecium]EJC3740386.1 CPBP family intramembrane metalloprotease [Enterococcus faecium]EJC3746218.1 CPBP family intramembrane metalloprotease [Enterococcus faecium]EKY8177131.1 CPBP family intramembrane metalloprotease [Enterococcus faecium]EMF0279177.1 CPBP family intramembrane metalloprotease [Enterococcus faecium]
MGEFISQVLSALVQFGVIWLILKIFWTIREKPMGGQFADYLGFKAPKGNINKILGYSVGSLLAFCAVGFLILKALPDPSILANGKFTVLNVWTTLSILVYAFIQTSLTEELLFRGFLAKRFIVKFGFIKGNLIQAILFGILHVALLVSAGLNVFVIVLIGIFTGVIGYILCWIDEKLALGSIYPSWIIHGLSNVVSSLMIIFVLK